MTTAEWDSGFEIKSVNLRVRRTPKSCPELVLAETPRACADDPVGLNQAAGLGIGGPQRIHARFTGGRLNYFFWEARTITASVFP